LKKGNGMTRPRIVAPSHLRRETAEWWRSVHKGYELEPHHMRLLTMAAETWDRAQQAREAIAKDGLTVGTRDGGLKAHPAVGIERDCRLAFARLVRELDLDTEGPSDHRRPPALRSNRG
jgi:P27 family predicted phage terminase small subunit